MGQELSQEIMQDRKKFSPQLLKYILISLTVVLLILFILAIIITYNLLNYANIHSGIYIGDFYVGKLDKNDAIQSLQKNYDNVLKNGSIVLFSEGEKEEISYKEIDVEYNIEDAVEKAFIIGREGNIFKKIISILEKRKANEVIKMDIAYNKEKLEDKILNFSEKVNIPVTEIQHKIDNDVLLLINGTPGKEINKENTINKIINFISEGLEGGISLEREIINPKPFDVNKLHEETFVLPSDAKYVVENYRLNIIPHVIGVDFDKQQAQKIKEEFSQDWDEIKIPLKISYPKVLKKDLENKFFNTKLAGYATNFNANYRERSHNIALAANKLNNIVLAPGDEFSFNNIVGERSISTGYQNAKVYMGDKIVDGIGGGICQVSTTLYNAVLLSDLEVTFRSNHSMTVSYVPVGQDAAVVYGALDFKFKNNKNNPIRINSNVNAGKISFEIYGTSENPRKTIRIENIIIEEEPFPIKETENTDLPKGDIIVEQYGGKGYVVDTYKIVNQNGEIISRNRITRSRYRPIQQIQVVGTKEVIQEEIIEEEVIPEIIVPEESISEEEDSEEGQKEDIISEEKQDELE